MWSDTVVLLVKHFLWPSIIYSSIGSKDFKFLFFFVKNTSISAVFRFPHNSVSDIHPICPIHCFTRIQNSFYWNVSIVKYQNPCRERVLFHYQSYILDSQFPT